MSEELTTKKAIDYLESIIYEDFSPYTQKCLLKVIEAANKEIAMPVKGVNLPENPEDVEHNGEDALCGKCPRCGEVLVSIWTPLYCGDCGQKVEWPEREKR